MSVVTPYDKPAALMEKSEFTGGEPWAVFGNNSEGFAKVKQEYVGANLDFINYKPKKNSIGGVVAGLDALVYINSFHDNFEWKKDANGNWTNVKTSTQSLHDHEGYRIAYGGQGDSNYLTHQEWIEIGDISQAVVNFLVERVLPLKNGTLVEEFQLGEKVMVA